MNKKVEPLNTKELADAGLALLFLVLANLFIMLPPAAPAVIAATFFF